jgi:cell division protein FtsB
MALDGESIGTTLTLGGIAAYALKRVVDWLGEKRQDSSLYKKELEAHKATRERLEAEIEEERVLRKAAEMDLRTTEREHDADRKAWRADREADREVMETLRNEVAMLKRNVSELTAMVDRRNQRNAD